MSEQKGPAPVRANGYIFGPVSNERAQRIRESTFVDEIADLAGSLLDARQEVARLEGEVEKLKAELDEWAFGPESTRDQEFREEREARERSDARVKELETLRTHETDQSIPVETTRIAAGWSEVFLRGDQLVVCGDPVDSERAELEHNCDAMGCGTFSHVLARARITTDGGLQESVERALREPDNLMPCGHPASALSEIQADFLGDTPATQKIGTAHCRECERIAQGGDGE